MFLFGFYHITFYAFLLQTNVHKCMYSAVQKWTEHISVSCVHVGLCDVSKTFTIFLQIAREQNSEQEALDQLKQKKADLLAQQKQKIDQRLVFSGTCVYLPEEK